MDLVALIASSAVSILVLVLQEWRLLLYFQQEEYSATRFLRLCIKNFVTLNIYFIVSLGLFWGIHWVGFVGINVLLFLRVAVDILIAWGIYREIKRPKKIELVYTARLKRLILSLILLTTIIKFGLDLLGYNPERFYVILYSDIGLSLVVALIVVIANLILMPIEWSIQQYYLRQAKENITKVSPLTIGITGSYGKTSTKEILNHILQGYKSVLATPKSYNTLMGVTKVINTSLQPSQEVFIVEMGAYRPGDIKAICDLVKPTIGIITAIGPQHLERFKSIDNVAKAKYELINSLPIHSVAIFNADDLFTKNFADLSFDKSVVLVSINNHPDAHLVASNIKATTDGIEFWVENKKSGEKVLFSTMLLGDHSVLNILFASAVALNVGMTMHSIRDRVKTLRPVTHRLQLIKLQNGVNIIDDAYNANPVGAQSALKALSLFSGRKVLVTPGLVELGEIQDQENYKLGQIASKVCDLVVLVGEKQTSAIRKGLTDEEFDSGKIEVVNTTQEGIAFVNGYAKSDDTILYLNDLPDIYSEKI